MPRPKENPNGICFVIFAGIALNLPLVIYLIAQITK